MASSNQKKYLDYEGLLIYNENIKKTYLSVDGTGFLNDSGVYSVIETISDDEINELMGIII